jgi:hypothetical protein
MSLSHLTPFVLLFLFIASFSFAEFDARSEIIKFMEGNKDLEKYLTAPVTISWTNTGHLAIKDKGIFAFQHALLTPEASCDPNVVINTDVQLDLKADKLVIATHGWLDKGEGDWPGEMAAAICERVDPNQWICGSYDWKGGSAVITSVQAAEYARDVAGPRLAKALLSLEIDFKHIHFIGHSAGSWVVHSAAQSIASARPETQFHLTFLDAYVPAQWNEDMLGDIFADEKKQQANVWAEHYYTKDFTFFVTEHPLKHAHNVDISAIDPLIREHEFPYRWYTATITGKFDRWDEKKEPVYLRVGDIDYGFARSLESGLDNWTQTRTLNKDNPPVKIEKKSN